MGLKHYILEDGPVLILVTMEGWLIAKSASFPFWKEKGESLNES